MIIFHEGLPRSGKSYAAMVDHICRCLKQGRKVFAYMAGLNYEKIAEAAELPLEDVQKLLHVITKDQVPEIYRFVENDALVVIDELQNFWPSGRAKLSPEITEFVTEHGHRGLDLLCMGQALADCHNLWKRRVENRIVFMKLSAVGAEDRYTWTLHKQVAPDRWQQVANGIESYNKRYFGTYKSHEDGTMNTANYKDSRAVIWNSKLFRLGLPAVGIVGALSIWYVIGIFSSDSTAFGKAPPAQPQRASVEPVRVEETTYKVMPDGRRILVSSNQAPPLPTAPPASSGMIPLGHIAKLTESNRVRLAAVILSSKPRVIIEWRDGAGRVIEKLEAADIQALGWQVLLTPTGSAAVLTNGTESHLVTPWPLDEQLGTVPARTNEVIAGTGV